MLHTTTPVTEHTEYIAFETPARTWTIGFYNFEHEEPEGNFFFAAGNYPSLESLREEYTIAEGPMNAHAYGTLHPERYLELAGMATNW